MSNEATPDSLETRVKAKFKEHGFDLPVTVIRDVVLEIVSDIDQRLRRVEQSAGLTLTQ